MNEKINLLDLAALLAEKAKITKREAETFLREYFEVMSEELLNDNILKIRDLGTFKLLMVEDRESIDVTNGERFIIPAHYKVSFTPDKKLAETVNEPFALFETIEIEDEPLPLNPLKETLPEDEEEDEPLPLNPLKGTLPEDEEEDEPLPLNPLKETLPEDEEEDEPLPLNPLKGTLPEEEEEDEPLPLNPLKGTLPEDEEEDEPLPLNPLKGTLPEEEEEEEPVWGRKLIPEDDEEPVFKKEIIREEKEETVSEEEQIPENLTTDEILKKYCHNCYDYRAHIEYRRKYFSTRKKLRWSRVITIILSILLALSIVYNLHLFSF